MSSTRFAFGLVLATLAGCGAPTSSDVDSGPDHDAASSFDDAGPGSDAGPDHDAGPLPDGAMGTDGGTTPVCEPTAGSATETMACDLLELAILRRTGLPDELRLSGRLFGTSGGSPTCAAIDGIDILSGTAVVQHLDGGASIQLDSQEAELGRGVPDASIAARCLSDENRFGGYGIVVTGRVDGGTFTARCADAEGGGRWPPALRITCHDNVEAPPLETAPSVMLSSFMGMSFSSTTLYTVVPHDAGGAVTAIDATVHIIPQRSIFDPGLPLAPHDTGPWMGSVSESLPPLFAGSSLSLFSDATPFGTDLCPPPEMGIPGPGYIPPPVFLARITGTSGHGTFSTELFANGCHTITSTPTP